MAGVKMMVPLVAKTSGRTVALPPKQVDPFYVSSDYRAWREHVIARAGRRCEAVDNGVRCAKAEPRHRLFADHVVELRDGGAPLDPANGRCLCGHHHTLKTARAKTTRAQGRGV